MEQKLLVLRGPSGSGKSTIARQVRLLQDFPTALIEQDYVRRILFREKDVKDGVNIKLIEKVTLFALENSYNVILEGIFNRSRYGEMFEHLIAAHPENNHFFYFNISFEETLRRHNTKPNKDEFGEKEMREWYKEKDLLGFVEERIISEASTQQEVLEQIMRVSA
jgi:shikimate kinase